MWPLLRGFESRPSPHFKGETMGTLLIIALAFVVLYIGAGFLVTFVNGHARGDTFKVVWKDILTWPKGVFFK